MRSNARKLLSYFLAAMLLAGQWAGQLHALSHAQHDLVVASLAPIGPSGGDGRHGPAPLNHSADLCVAFHALDGAAVATPDFHADPAPAQFFHADPGCTLRAADALPFLSRAPPVLS
jgi:hypothetical protein